MERIANETRDNLFFLDYAPVLIASALTGENVEQLFRLDRADSTRCDDTHRDRRVQPLVARRF